MEGAKFNCLVVDDEPIGRRIIINYIQQTPILRLASEQINAFDALEYLGAHRETDIIFLDINMPNISGLQMLKIAQPSQPVIFTTAYPEHAVESYELEAVDYLLKPFSFDRFTKAVFKAVNVINSIDKSKDVTHPDKPFYIKSEGKNIPVILEDILYCEAMKNYTSVVLKQGKKLMPLIPISRFETMLREAGGDFIQIHRSFIVSRKHIGAVTPAHVSVLNIDLPIGIQFKERLFKELGILK